jgi:hypothetical protein
MNLRIILLGLTVAAFSSCSTAYRTGQTPDDVYFSPVRETAAYAKVEDEDEPNYRTQDTYRSNDYVNAEDRWLRMRVRNPYRWSAFDDYGSNDWRYNSWNYNSYSPYYSYSPFNTYSPFNNYWSSYYSWNSYYNPYCSRVIVVNPKTNPVVYDRIRNFNLNSYSNNSYSNANRSSSGNKVMYRGSSNSGYNNNNSTLGNSVRRVFSNSNRDTYISPSSSDRPTRSYQPSSSSSSSSPSSRSGGSSGSSGGSSGSSSSGGGSGSRPSRGN